MATGAHTRTEATFTPSAPASPADLQQTATQLQHRAGAFGLSEVRIEVSGSHILASAAGATAEQFAALAKQGQLSFRPVLALAPSIKAPAAPTPAATKVGLYALATDAPSASAAPMPGSGDLSAALTQGAVPADLITAFAALDCSDSRQRIDHQSSPSAATVACSYNAEQNTWFKFALGPVAVDGKDVSGAQAAFDDRNGAGWQINLSFNGVGGRAFADVTGRLATQPSPSNQFAIVLDGAVVSHAYVTESIPGGNATISGSFSSDQAQQLAALIANRLPIGLALSTTTPGRSGSSGPSADAQ
ncbi:hypothetical protein GCM10018790_64300 [Kitasatospora xanthocidica]|nr:hypothetical protein GCM10018790_64300 [Kitasatospora xanthocidica]